MNASKATLLLVILSGLGMPLERSVGQTAPTPKQIEYFEKKIRPVLVDQCYSCHSKDSKAVKGGLLVDTREAIRAGGDSGHAVVPGDLDASLILEAIRYESYEMPPKQQLPPSVIKDFERWIEMGAPDPREGPSLIKREIDFHEAKSHWSFQPIQSPQVPEVQDPRWSQHPIDRFVYSRLAADSLTPAPPADRRTLIRRLYFDLLGLPPTPAQMQAALEDQAPNAYERLVDSLLDSPQYGERWGRHWLDVVRYAESNGRERNHVFPTAWRYRDYVIDAFNEDKPFDRFVHEQVAGDLLDDGDAGIDIQQANENLVATGFLAIGPKLLNEGNRNEFLMDMVDEQLDVTTRAFMGLTVSCARCHDHKFDPIPTSEYYSMAGIFRSTKTLYGTKKVQGNRQATELASLRTDRESSAEEEARLKKALEQVEKRIANQQRLATESQQKLRSAQKKRNQSEVTRLKRAGQSYRRNVASLRKELEQLKANGLADKTMGVTDGKPGNSPIYVRGEVSNPKGVAPRGFLTILDPELKQPLLETDQSGRLELAHWITQSQNPLTARVQVNRIWLHLFGTGLVRTVDNFGATGEAPSHPDLLDYLAHRFRENGWSVKQLIREIVTSESYRLSSQFVEADYEVDPQNRLVWRHQPRRIDAEALRDAVLLASGELDLTPMDASPVSKAEGEFGRQVRDLKTAIDANVHRSVYLPIVRNAVPEVLKLFDFAEPSILVGDRPVTTVPTQALYFLNSDFIASRCDQLAQRLLGDGSHDDAARVDTAYQRVLSRPARPQEVSRALEYLEIASNKLSSRSDDADTVRQQAWSSFCQTLFGSAEFRYVE